ncbi:hypothetical protein niasHT_018837 [Heterodera trifolii]|uniref:Uncharacterized protein n=1 Tax=Heterodera trifolii TaxID=157864 RepID=A0ABD2L3G4_9BILA
MERVSTEPGHLDDLTEQDKQKQPLDIVPEEEEWVQDEMPKMDLGIVPKNESEEDFSGFQRRKRTQQVLKLTDSEEAFFRAQHREADSIPGERENGKEQIICWKTAITTTNSDHTIQKDKRGKMDILPKNELDTNVPKDLSIENHPPVQPQKPPRKCDITPGERHEMGIMPKKELDAMPKDDSEEAS